MLTALKRASEERCFPFKKERKRKEKIKPVALKDKQHSAIPGTVTIFAKFHDMRSDFWIQKMQINCDLSQWPLRNQCARQAGLVCSKCGDHRFHGPARVSAEKACKEEARASCHEHSPQDSSVLPPSASSPVPPLACNWWWARPRQQTAGSMPEDHTSVVYRALFNQLPN